ncbi:hypothetical protein [Catellatospora sichuanensis]|uniref:hypothetical protein n=1 Tax=Catellatospora sichuanensis TaxID=1969805 RepID=UPI001183C041|nr:hypothetical protein [Catellatospora sichuanensis]
MTNGRRRALLGIATMMAVGVGTLATPAVASAAEATSASVSIGSLVLEPTDRGYAGTLATTVTNTGTEPAWLSISIVEPVANSWQKIEIDDVCFWNWNADGRRTITCGIGSQLAPGEERRVDSTFRVLSKTRKYAMEALGGEIGVLHNDGTSGPTTPFSALFRSTTGSVADPRPFVQDTRSNITLKVGKALKLKKDTDGRFRGRLPVTVTWRGNAPHQYVPVDLVGLPDGVWADGTDPDGGMPCFTGCAAPGGEFMQGETRTFDLIVSAAEDAVVGDYGTITATSGVSWGPDWETTPDVDPADNTRTLTFKIVA